MLRSHTPARRRISILLAFMVMIPFLAVFSGDARVAAQASDWSEPYLLFEGSGRLDRFTLAADQTGIVHAFWTYNADNRAQLYYSRNAEGVWSEPIDILFDRTIRFPSVAADSKGLLHLVWSDGANLLYSSSIADQAASAKSWSRPVMLAEGVMGHIETDGTGNVHLAYVDPGSNSVYWIESLDAGGSWSAPQLVSSAMNGDSYPYFIRMAVTPGGHIHVIWDEMEAPRNWPPYGVYHAWSVNDGGSWQVRSVAGSDYIEGNVLSVDDETIHVVWNGRAGTSGRYHQWSEDGGETWTEPLAFVPSELSGGSTDPPAVVLDNSGVIHAVTNTRPGAAEGSELTMYSHWRGETWSVPEDISSSTPGYNGMINEQSVVEITQGNLLHVLYKDNDESRLWHRQRTTDAPATSTMPMAAESTEQEDIDLSAAGSEPSVDRGVTVAASETVTSPVDSGAAQFTPDPDWSSEPASRQRSPNFGVVMSISTAVLVVGFTLLIQVGKRRR